jgi:Uma2 family endonuclease
MSTSTQITAEQLLARRNDGNRYELVQGELRMMSPSGNEHGAVTARLTWRLAKYVEENGRGAATAGQASARRFETARPAADLSGGDEEVGRLLAAGATSNLPPWRGYWELPSPLVGGSCSRRVALQS